MGGRGARSARSGGGGAADTDENGFATMSSGEYKSVMGYVDPNGLLRQPNAPYRVVGNSATLGGKLTELQASKTPIAARRAAGNGTRYDLTNVRVIHVK